MGLKQIWTLFRMEKCDSGMWPAANAWRPAVDPRIAIFMKKPYRLLGFKFRCLSNGAASIVAGERYVLWPLGHWFSRNSVQDLNMNNCSVPESQVWKTPRPSGWNWWNLGLVAGCWGRLQPWWWLGRHWRLEGRLISEPGLNYWHDKKAKDQNESQWILNKNKLLFPGQVGICQFQSYMSDANSGPISSLWIHGAALLI